MFRKAVYLQPQNAEAHTMLGLLAFYSNNYEEAELEFKEAMKYTPERTFLYLALAVTLTQMKQWSQAEQYIIHAKEHMPEDPAAFMLHIFIKIEQEFYTEALDLCVQAVEKFPNFEEKLILLK